MLRAWRLRLGVLVGLAAALGLASCGEAAEQSVRQDLVDEAVAMVQDIRGLTLDNPIPIRVVTTDEMADYWGTGEGGDLEPWLDVQRALGFAIPDGYADLLGETVVPAGVYQPELGQILIDEEYLDDPVVLIHELTHAAQDQHYGLWFGSPRGGASQGWLALVEGDAEWVSSHYEIDFHEHGGDHDIGSELLPIDLLSTMAPYVLGPGFVDALVGRGGLALLDEAFTAPPTSLGPVIWSSRYSPADPGELGGRDLALDIVVWAALLEPHGTPEEVWTLLSHLRHDALVEDEDDPDCLGAEWHFDAASAEVIDVAVLERWTSTRPGATFAWIDGVATAEGLCPDGTGLRGPEPGQYERALLTALAVQGLDRFHADCPSGLAARHMAAEYLTDPTGADILVDAIDQAASECSQQGAADER